MKVLIICGILVTALCFSCIKEPTYPLEGAWELVKGEYKSKDSVLSYPMTIYSKHMKIITKTHFATVWQDTTNPSSIYPGFNGGTYTFVNGLYTEDHDYHSTLSRFGKKSFYKVRFEGNKFFMSSATEDGKDTEFGFFEEWKRLE
jgi:hypothetical protein